MQKMFFLCMTEDKVQLIITVKNEKIMKKLFVAFAAMMLSLPSFAQYSSGGFDLSKENVYYGLRIGLTAAGINGDSATDPKASLDYGSSKVGMTLAGVIGLRLSSSTPVFIESGLYYTERGGKSDNYKCGINYFEIPVLIKYGVKASDDIALLPFFGPYFSYGLGGNIKCTSPYEGVTKGSHFNSFEKEHFAHSDMGFKLGCGAEYNKLYLEIGYQFGVKNISKSDQLDAHGRAFFANVGVNF